VLHFVSTTKVSKEEDSPPRSVSPNWMPVRMPGQARDLSDRMRKFRRGKPEERPSTIDHWELHYGEPPYQELIPVKTETAVLARLSPISEPPRGPILVAEPEHIDPNHHFREVTWFRTALPWVSLIVLDPKPAQTDPLGRRITGLARTGALVVPNGKGKGLEIAMASRGAFNPATDLGTWFGSVLPGWPRLNRAGATAEFISGFEYDPEAHYLAHQNLKLPSRTGVWHRVGRAARAAMAIQTRSVEPWRRVALGAGYADIHSMDGAIKRLFGVSRRCIVGTVGWEWLVWRFLCGLGKGKAKNWT